MWLSELIVRWAGSKHGFPTPAAHGSAKLVATTHDGPVTGTVTLGYADGSTSNATITVADWCGTAAAGTTSLLDMPHRIKAGMGEDGPPVSLFGVTLPLQDERLGLRVSFARNGLPGYTFDLF